MWFSNLQIYRFTKPFTLTALELEEKLAAHLFTPCSHQQTSSYGWVTPLGKHSEQLVHASNGYFMVSAKEQERILPAAVVNEKLEERIRELEEKDGREVYRKEKTAIKDELIFELLPRAFTRSKLHFAYIAPQQGLLVVNSASAKRAENLLNQLRESIGSLAVIPLSCKNIASHSMTHWLAKGDVPEPFAVGSDCELKDSQQGSSIRIKQADLHTDEVLAHVNSGMYVSQLQMHWQDRVSCIIDENMAIKRLKFSDIVQEESLGHDDDIAASFDADFAIMTAEIDGFINDLIRAFGGEDNAQQ